MIFEALPSAVNFRAEHKSSTPYFGLNILPKDPLRSERAKSPVTIIIQNKILLPYFETKISSLITEIIILNDLIPFTKTDNARVFFLLLFTLKVSDKYAN